MKTQEAIQRHLRERLVQCVEVQAEKFGEEEWTTGIQGAILQGHIDLLTELLDWIDTN